MPTNNNSASSLTIDALNSQLDMGVRSPFDMNPVRSAASFAIASGGTFTDNASSNFAGVLSNPFDDARVYANGAVTLNGTPVFSGFGNGLTLGPTGTLQNVSAAIATSLKLGRVTEAVAIDVPAYLVPTVGTFDRTIDVSMFPLNGAADVAGAFGGGVQTVQWTGGGLNLPTATVLKNLTIVVENGDVNFNGDRHLLENVRLVVLNGSVNLGDVRAVNTSVYSAGAIRMNGGARFAGKNFLGTRNGDVAFNGATETIGANDYVKVVAQGDIFLNASANTRGDFWSTEDFFVNRESSIVGKIRAKQSITLNAAVRMIGDVLQNSDFPLANQPAIGIIDTGFAGNNPDIDYSRVTDLGDRVDGDNNSFLSTGEGNQHGTHTLGIIAATQNNNLGIDGVNRSAPLYISRAVGSGQWANSVVDFIDKFEADSMQPRPIIYLGFDLTQLNADGSITTRYELTLEERSVLEYARQKGALIVVPAGNDGGVMSALGQAAQEFDNIVTVGAVDASGRAAYSSYGAGLTIMAPGGTVDDPIVSTVGDGLGSMAGTSVAGAYAVGQIANIWAANPGLSYQQVIDIVKATAWDIGEPGYDEETGSGIIDMNAAIELAQQTMPETYDPPATILPESWSGEGLISPLERASGNIVAVRFAGKVSSGVTIGAILWSGPGTKSYNSTYIRNGEILPGAHPSLVFDAWSTGQSIEELGRKDNRWYRISNEASIPVEYRGKWISATLIDGGPPTDSVIKPKPVIPINTNSPFYRNGRENPFANFYALIGQCTWYAYGRMLETGLLPAGAKANGLFRGNAEAWRRDAARAGLAVNSRPTPGTRGLVVWPPGVQGGHRLYGHVAFVEEVYADGSIRISESNWAGRGVGSRTLTVAQQQGLKFMPLEGARSNPGLNSPSAQPGAQREYRIRAGDTLSGIAVQKLGNASRWREIKRADGSLFTEEEARKLSIGQSIYLPVVFGGDKTVTPNTTGKPKVEPVFATLFPIIIKLINLLPSLSGSGFNRDRAVQYAKQYADQPNSDYHYFKYNKKLTKDLWATFWNDSLIISNDSFKYKYKEEDFQGFGGDCTNFVAQCLIHGGIISLEKATEGWHNGKRVLKNTFTAVDNLLSYLKNEGLSSQKNVWGMSEADRTTSIRQFLKPGDIISYEFLNPETTGDHLSIFIGYDENGDPLGANHTTDGMRKIKLEDVEKLISVNSKNLDNSVTFT